jgi:integrase/recombinase XerD
MHPNALDHSRLCLRIHDWPERHRAKWYEIMIAAGPLDEGGSGAHWRGPTKLALQKAWGRYLNWLQLYGFPNLNTSEPTDVIVSDLFMTFIDSLRMQGLKTISIASITSNIETLAKAWYPLFSWNWLSGLRRRIWSQSIKRKAVTNKLIFTDKAFQIVLRYMDNATKKPKHLALDYHCRYRDGLLLAILICRCPRLLNLTKINIGKNLIRGDEGFALYYSDDEMKNHVAMRIPLPAALTSYIECYLSDHRPALLGRGNSEALWISNRGLAMTASSVGHRVRIISKRLFGKEINPHTFRHSGATTAVVKDPDGVYGISALLQHKSPHVAEAHYQQAQTIISGRRYAGVLKLMRSTLKSAKG